MPGRRASLRRSIKFNAIKPADGLEALLVTQMIGTHAAAVECQRRAMLPAQTVVGRDMELKHAQKLMTLYTQQLAALDKHRGKGQQKITIERVNVESGGQAIVGNVDAGAAARPPEARRRKVAPAQITSVPPPANPLDGLRDPVPRRQGEGAKATWLITPAIPGRCARHGVAAPEPAREHRARRLPLPARPDAGCTAAPRDRARLKATGTRSSMASIQERIAS